MSHLIKNINYNLEPCVKTNILKDAEIIGTFTKTPEKKKEVTMMLRSI
ncbi:hypothetical protein [Chryseobacterium soli]|nr:hypothetical protein [Chryseobacterium soli]